MPLSDNDRRSGPYTATADQTVFSYDFKVEEAAWLRVTRYRGSAETTLVLTTDYTVTGAGDANGGTIVLTAGATANDIIVIDGLAEDERAADYDTDTLDATEMNAEAERLFRGVQEVRRAAAKALRLPHADNQELIFPKLADWYDNVAIPKSDGTWLLVAESDISQAAANATAAAASATAASASETAAAGSATAAAASAILAAAHEKGFSQLANVAAFKALAATGLSSGDHYYLRGYSSIADGGEGVVRILTGSASSNGLTADDGMVFENTAATLTAVRVLEGQAIRPEMYGAAGDGTTDDGTKITAAWGYARANGLTLEGNDGSVYYMASTSGYSISTVGKYAWRRMKLRSNPLLASPFLYFAGPAWADELALTANVSIGDTAVTVASGGTAYSAGDLCALYSEEEYHGTSESNADCHKTFFARVASATATTITLTQKVPRSFKTADSAKIFRLPETMEVDFDGVIVENQASSPVAGNVGMRFDNSVVTLNACEVDTVDDSCFILDRCYRPRVTGCRALHAKASGTGYGWNTAGCFSPFFFNNYARDVRHAIALGSGASGTPQNKYDYVLGQGGVSIGLLVEDARDSGLDCHPGHDGFIFTDSEIWCTSGALENGATVQGTNIDIHGLRVHGGAGIFINLQHFGTPADEPDAIYNFSGLDATESLCTFGLNCESRDQGNYTGLTCNVQGLAGKFTNRAFLCDGTSSVAGGNGTLNVRGLEITVDGQSAAQIDTRKFKCRWRISLQGNIRCESGSGYYTVYAVALNDAVDYTTSGMTLTLSAASGATVTATAQSGIFQQEHVGDFIREETSGSGVGEIIEVQSDTVAIIDTTVTGGAYTGAAFSGTSISAGNWKVSAGYPPASVIWESGISYRDASEYHFRTIDGEIILSAELKVFGSKNFKVAASGLGEVYRHAAAAVATA